MDGTVEAHEIVKVEARLAERFPQLDPGVITAAVRSVHSELTGGIRDFVPVLVEHNARDRLAQMAAGETSPHERRG
jgi:hypothetical protein